MLKREKKEGGEINNVMEVKTIKSSVIANYYEVAIVDFDGAIFSTPSVCAFNYNSNNIYIFESRISLSTQP